MCGAAASGLRGIPSPNFKVTIVNDQWRHESDAALIYGRFPIPVASSFVVSCSLLKCT